MLESRPTGDIYVQMAPAIAPLVKKEFNEMKAYCRVAEGSANGVITIEKPGRKGSVQSFREDRLAYADGSFFTLFKFPLLYGNAQSALSETNTIAL